MWWMNSSYLGAHRTPILTHTVVSQVQQLSNLFKAEAFNGQQQILRLRSCIYSIHGFPVIYAAAFEKCTKAETNTGLERA